MAFALVTYFYRQHVHNTARRHEMAQNISDTSVRMSQGDEGDEDNDDAGNNPPPHPPCKCVLRREVRFGEIRLYPCNDQN